MSPLPSLRTSLACVLIFSLFITGLLTFTPRQSHASNNSLRHSLTLSANESSDKTALDKTALPAGTVDEATRARVGETLGQLPLSFEENRGQVDTEVKYVSRGSGYTLFLTKTEAVLTLRKAESGKRNEKQARDFVNPQSAIGNPQSAVLRMKLSGANHAPAITGESEMAMRTNYFKGNDPAKWHTDVARYERVRYEQVYPGIDMVYYGQQQQLEYDFEVAPGANTSQIALEYRGVKRVKVERGTGDLVLKTAGGEVRQHKPVAYQEVGGERREVESRYVIRGQRKVGIEVEEYDHTKRLVIDPVLSYSTYLGGDNGDEGRNIAVDPSGNVYVTGFIDSTDFPKRNEHTADQGGTDAFMTKLNPNLSGAASLRYSTYLGGSNRDLGLGIAADASGHAYVTGYTYSNDFPTLNEYQTYQEGGADAFITKLDTKASGAASLLYSTYLGGTNKNVTYGDVGWNIAVDSSGIAYVTGYSESSDFPVRHQYQTYQGGGADAFVAKLDTNASGAASLLYSTYLGGIDLDIGQGIAIDSSGIAYVTGFLYSTNFPTLNPFQTHLGGGYDTFVAKLDTNASGAASLLYSTYLGGYGDDYSFGIAVDASGGNVYVTGYTGSANFPTRNQYQTYRGNGDAFVTKLDTQASGAASLRYSTYLGGHRIDYGWGIAVDASDNAYVVGSTNSADFPTLNQYQTHQVGYDTFVTKLSGAYSISGRVTGDGTTGISGVTVTLGGSQSGTVVTDGSGNYSFINLQRGDYTVTPSRSGLTFVPSEQSFTNLQADQTNVNFRAQATISGKVTLGTADGAGAHGVTITLTDGEGFTPRTTTTASDGTYSFTGVPTHSNYTLTPSKTSYRFRPPKIILNDVTANRPNQNFVATRTYTISGVVKLGKAELAGVTVKLSSPTPVGFTPRTTTTTSLGAYSFTNVPAGRNYTVTPQKVGYQFTPANRMLTNLSADHPAVNFAVTVYFITGRITRTNTTNGISGVTVTLTSPTPAGYPTRTAQTYVSGNYYFYNLPAGRDYTIKPTKTGLTFTPTTRSITNLSSDIPAGSSTNFTGTGP